MSVSVSSVVWDHFCCTPNCYEAIADWRVSYCSTHERDIAGFKFFLTGTRKREVAGDCCDGRERTWAGTVNGYQVTVAEYCNAFYLTIRSGVGVQLLAFDDMECVEDVEGSILGFLAGKYS